MKKENIKKVLDCMLDSIEQEQIDLYKKLIDEKCKTKINNIEDFYFNLIYPFKKFIAGLIKVEISKNDDVAFILQNSQFIDRHFVKWIEKIEGRACCADKSKTILRKLFEFYKNNEKIKFDYTQKYTFHLPKIIFKTHEDIIGFYEGLKNLYYGNSEKYFKFILKLRDIK